MLTIHTASHLDHSVTPEQLAWILEQCKDRTGFFIETFELPEDLGTVPCGLYGPIMGDERIPESQVKLEMRGDRAYPSRMLPGAEKRATRKLSVIAGPHDGLDCVLYTIFGGPVAPKEPGDIAGAIDRRMAECNDLNDSVILKLQKELNDSLEFWCRHALAY